MAAQNITNESIAGLIVKNGALSQWTDQNELKALKAFLQVRMATAENVNDPHALWCLMDLLDKVQTAIGG